MIHTILSFIEKDDYMKIFKALTYSIYQDKILSVDEVNYLNTLIKQFTIDDEIVSNIFTIDSRYEIEFKHITEDMTLSSCKTLLFLFSMTSSLFDNSNLKRFMKSKVLADLPFDSKTKNIIIERAEKYTNSLILLFNYIYKVEKESLLSKKNNNAIMQYKKLSLIDEDKILEINKDEKDAFLKILVYLMSEDEKISDTEKDFLLTYSNYFGIDKTDLDINTCNPITLETIKRINTPWFINLLICIYVLSQESKEDKSDFFRLYEVTDILGINKKEVDINLNLIKNYKEVFEKSIDILKSKKISTSGDEKLSEGLTIGVNTAFLLLSTLPPVKLADTIVSVGANVSNLRNDSSGLDYGLCEIRKNNTSNEMIICIDGFCSESNDKQFDDWSKTLDNLKINSRVKGFKWPSGNLKLFSSLSSIVTAWPNAVSNTGKAADKLIKDIALLLEMKPDLKITLAGHSLGSRVIFKALLKLRELDYKIENVYLLGGAVSRTDKAGWTEALSSVNNTIYNFYSINDDVLNRLYQKTMFGDKPIGLGDIEYYIYKDQIIGELINVDVSHLVNGHTEYKDKLDLILTDNNKYKYSLFPNYSEQLL